MSIGVVWDHDVDQSVAPGMTAHYRDWAQFSCAAQYSMELCGKVTGSVKIGYAYVAFRPDYDAHTITVQGLVKF